MGKQPAVSVSASHFISLKLSYSSSTNSSPLQEERPVSVGMGAPCGDPQGMGTLTPLGRGSTRAIHHGFLYFLQACWHLIVQDVPGLGGPAVMLSLSNRASMAPYLRESSTCGKLVSLPTSLASTLLSTISPQCCLCYHYYISHPNPPPETTCGLASHPQ